MEHKIICTEFYQTQWNEIFAVVTAANKEGNEQYKFIPGIERANYTGETLLEEAVNGFPGHPLLDLVYKGEAVFEYLGIHVEEGHSDIFDLVEASDAVPIADIWCENMATLYFQNMGPHAYPLFCQMHSVMEARGYEL